MNRLVLSFGVLAAGMLGLAAASGATETNKTEAAIPALPADGEPKTEVKAAAKVSGNGWGGIADRNPFGLRPPQAPPAPGPTTQPASNVKFSGISSLFGPKRVFLAVQEGRDTRYLKLQEGERDGAIEVLSINEAAREVKVRNAGEEILLTFETHGLKPNIPVTAAKPGVPGMPGLPMPPQPMGFVPAAAAQPVPVPNSPRSRDGETLRFGTPGGAPAGVAPESIRSVPSRTMRLMPSTAPQTQPPTSKSKNTAEESSILLEVQRTVSRKEIRNGELPPLPPAD